MPLFRGPTVHCHSIHLSPECSLSVHPARVRGGGRGSALPYQLDGFVLSGPAHTSPLLPLTMKDTTGEVLSVVSLSVLIWRSHCSLLYPSLPRMQSQCSSGSGSPIRRRWTWLSVTIPAGWIRSLPHTPHHSYPSQWGTRPPTTPPVCPPLRPLVQVQVSHAYTLSVITYNTLHNCVSKIGGLGVALVKSSIILNLEAVIFFLLNNIHIIRLHTVCFYCPSPFQTRVTLWWVCLPVECFRRGWPSSLTPPLLPSSWWETSRRWDRG